MINTRINDESDLKKVKELGEKVKKEVNRLYRTLELEIDGIFRSKQRKNLQVSRPKSPLTASVAMSSSF